MSYLSDYLYFTSGTECPEQYRIWSALTLLGTVIGKKIWTMHGRYPIHPHIYTILIGEPSSGKSTAKNDAKKLLVENFPQILTAASFQSFQDIVDLMANCQPRTWEEFDDKGTLIKIHAYTPFFAICNEFKSLLNVDPEGMTEFLVDIFDETDFSTGFKNMRLANPERKQSITNPSVSILACAQPSWFMEDLKMDLFSGGLGRRLILVNPNEEIDVDDPVNVSGGQEARERVASHLKEADKITGPITRTDKAMLWWRGWYYDNKKEARQMEDPILMQFRKNKQVPLLKVAIIVSMCDNPFTRTITDDHLALANTFLLELEPQIQRLTCGIGRNELAQVGARLLDFVARMGGCVSVQHTRRFFNRYMNNREFMDVFQGYIDTKQLALLVPPGKDFNGGLLMTPEYEKNRINGALAPQQQETKQ